MTPAIINERALKVLRDFCVFGKDGKERKSIIFSISSKASKKVDVLRIDYETNHWKLATGHCGIGMIALIAHLFKVPEADVYKKMAPLLARAKNNGEIK